MRDTRLFIEPRMLGDYFAIFLVENVTGKRYLATKIEMSEMNEASIPEPSFRLAPLAMQELMDSLWQAGIRPSEGSGSAGSLKATENHLKDLQNLSWRLMTMIEKGSHGATNPS